jgi:hypothetical protein
MIDQPSAVDFEIEFYKSHRTHELALTNAEATLEQSLLRFYFLINAGSLGAFIAFVQGNWREFEQDTTFCIHATLAMVLWGVGVVLSLRSTLFWYEGQKAYTQACRFRREAVEVDHVRLDSDPSWPKKFGIELQDNEDASDPKKVAERLRKSADDSRSNGSTWTTRASCVGRISILLAVVGFVIALWTMFGERPRRVVEGNTLSGPVQIVVRFDDRPYSLVEVMPDGMGIESPRSLCLLRCPSLLREK